ncbi:LLM class F420-dependent oxidoreductase [Cryptosporangium minutisporangium]|uniref:LLM class F420-dependent oxidoreductase n=1 Tax=Cryptosporangium minutisporangium TaxID=113569 RepID=A0ABP6TAJ5_9ACTN
MDPTVAVAVAVAAENAGWESVWTGEHYVVPDPPLPGSPIEPDLAVLDPFLTLGLVAGATRTLRLGTGVTVVPVHPAALLAKHAASLDRISGGRFLFGVGVGYLEPEFRALGVPLADRGSRTDVALDVLATLWAGGATRINGADVRAEPGPLRPGGPPLHVGGESSAALRRAVRRGDGWYGWQMSPDAAAAAVQALAALSHERTAPLEISVTPDAGRRLDPPTVAAYAAAGVDRLIVVPPRRTWWDADALTDFAEQTPARLLS